MISQNYTRELCKIAQPLEEQEITWISAFNYIVVLSVSYYSDCKQFHYVSVNTQIYGTMLTGTKLTKDYKFSNSKINVLQSYI